MSGELKINYQGLSGKVLELVRKHVIYEPEVSAGGLMGVWCDLSGEVLFREGIMDHGDDDMVDEVLKGGCDVFSSTAAGIFEWFGVPRDRIEQYVTQDLDGKLYSVTGIRDPDTNYLWLADPENEPPVSLDGTLYVLIQMRSVAIRTWRAL